MTVKTINVCADEWKALPWKKFQKNLFRLQPRIFKAAKKMIISQSKVYKAY
jgi:hypothetical protein